MATYTLTTSALEDKALQRVLSRENALRAVADPPRPQLTAEQLIDGLLRERLRAAVEDMRADERQALIDAYQAAGAATQNQVKALLRVS